MTTAQIEQQTTALTLPQRAAVALGTAEHEIKLRELVKASARIVEVKNVAGRDEAHGAMMQLKNARVSIEKAGKAAREDATSFSKAVIAEEKRLIGITEAEENRLQAIRDKWDADREAERQAKIAAERQRVAEIQRRITNIRSAPNDAVGHSAAEISAVIGRLAAATIGDEFEEFADEAQQARLTALDQLAKAETKQRGIEIEAEAQRQEAARLIAEREELARLRQEAEARRAEDERKAAEARAAQEAELAEDRRKQEAELAEQRAEAARQQAERDAEAAAQARAAKEAQEAARAAMDAERAELQRQRDELEAIKRQAEEDEAERVRLQQAADQALADARNPEPVAAPTASRPTDEEVIQVVADHFNVPVSIAYGWLLEMSHEIEYA